MTSFSKILRTKGTNTYDGELIGQSPLQSAIGADELPGGVGIIRTKLAEILKNKLEALDVNIILNNTINEISQTSEQVSIVLKDGEQRVYDLLIGADGVRSRVRNLIFPEFKGSQFTHQGSWRVVVPRLLENCAIFLGKELKAGMNPISATQSYLYILDHIEKDEIIDPQQWSKLLSNLLSEFKGVITTSSPTLMLARLIGETQRIRLGAGGMMLPNFPPLVIAEQFGLLSALAPERIDLGIGRAPGTDMETATALRRGQLDKEDFPSQFKELLCFLDDNFSKKAPYSENVYAIPGPRQDQENGVARSFERPPVWLLGSSTYSARMAAERGFPFAFAAHLADENLEMAVEVYREKFRPSKVLAKPYVIASFGVMAADDPVEAKRQAWSYAHTMMRMVTRRSFVVPTPDEAENYDYTATELRLIRMWDRKIMKGTGKQVIEQLNEWQQRIHADELMVINLGHTPEAIYRSTELIADAYGLPNNVLDE